MLSALYSGHGSFLIGGSSLAHPKKDEVGTDSQRSCLNGCNYSASTSVLPTPWKDLSMLQVCRPHLSQRGAS